MNDYEQSLLDDIDTQEILERYGLDGHDDHYDSDHSWETFQYVYSQNDDDTSS